MAAALRASVVAVGLCALVAPGARVSGADGGAEPGIPPVVHTRLRSSVPADGDTLRRAPSSLRLTFTRPVEAELAEVRLLGAEAAPRSLEMEADPEDLATLAAPLPDLSRGSYRVEWSVLSMDGHRIAGSFVFWLHPRETADSAEDARPPAPADAPTGSAAGEAEGVPLLLSLLRGAADFALLAWAGLLLFLAWPEGAPSGGARRTAVAVALGATALLLAHAVAWAAHTIGPEAPASASVEAVLQTLPGRVVAWRLVLVLLALPAFLLGRRHRVALVLAGTAVVTGAALGHSAVMEPFWSIPAKAIHLLAVSAWLGGLLFLATGPREGPAFRDAALRVSFLALAAVVAIALTGVVQAFLLMPALIEGLSSRYGILVLAKVTGLLALVGFGAFNRRRLLPALPAEREARALRRSVGREIVIVLLVVLVAGVLANVSPPMGPGD